MAASVKRRMLLFVVSLTITIIYLALGAIVMRTLERPREDENIEAGQKEVEHLINDLNLTQKDMDILEDTGICDFHKTPNWTLTGALFFTLTVITTIGYGSFAPATQSGRAFTAFYAIIGIGIVGQMLATCAVLITGIIGGLAERFKKRDVQERTLEEENQEWEIEYGNLVSQETGLIPAANLQPFLELITGGGIDPGIANHLLQVVDPAQTGFITPAGAVRATSLWHKLQAELPRGISFKQFCFHIGAAGTWICLWATVFMAIEGWSYRESVWFCFVSMSTIGFGDFTPASHAGRMMSFLFIVPGLGLGAAALGALWDAFDSRRYWWLQKKYDSGKVSKKLLEAHGIHFAVKNPENCQLRRDFYLRKQGDLEQFMSGGGSGIGPGMVRMKTQPILNTSNSRSVHAEAETTEPVLQAAVMTPQIERTESDLYSNLSMVRDPHAFPRSPQLPAGRAAKNHAGLRYHSLGNGFAESGMVHEEDPSASQQYSRMEDRPSAVRRKKTITTSSPPFRLSDPALPPLGGFSPPNRSGYAYPGEVSPMSLSTRSDARPSAGRNRKSLPQGGVIPGGSVRVGPGVPRVVNHKGVSGTVSTNGSGAQGLAPTRTTNFGFDTHSF